MNNQNNATNSVLNTEISKGSIVLVKDFSGKILERLVWKVMGDSVFVCTSRVYEALTSGSDAPDPIGFPASDVQPKGKGLCATAT